MKLALTERFFERKSWRAAGQGILRSTLFKRLAWDESSPPVTMADLLRIHEWNYVLSIKEFCQKLESEAIPIGHLDGDTAVSSRTYDAALAAAGAVCRGVDAIMEGRVGLPSSSPASVDFEMAF